VIAGIGKQDDHKDIDKGQTGGQKYEFSDFYEIFRYRQFLAEIFMGEYAHIFLALKEKEPEKNQNEPDDEGRGDKHVEHETEVLIVDDPEEFEKNSYQKNWKRCRGHGRPDQRQLAPGNSVYECPDDLRKLDQNRSLR
jgi:hypothetical protein